MFPSARRRAVTMELIGPSSGVLTIELLGGIGSPVAARVTLSAGEIHFNNTAVAKFDARQTVRLTLECDVERGSCVLTINGVEHRSALEHAADAIERLSIYTGMPRGIGGAKPVAPGTDRPLENPRHFSILLV